MSEPVKRWILSATIQITGTLTQKNNVKDAFLALMQTAVDNDNIDECRWSVNENEVPEGGVIK